MSTLYELTADMEQLYSMLVDCDKDEEDIIIDTMEGIEGEFEYKAEGYGKIIRQLEADALIHKKEAERHMAIAERSEKRMKWLKERLKDAMTITGKTKFNTDLFRFSVVKNGGVNPLEINEELVPDKYKKTKTETVIDNGKIREDLLAGIELPFAKLKERGSRLDIK